MGPGPSGRENREGKAYGGKARVQLGHHESSLVPEKSVGPGEIGRPALKVWI